MAYCSPNDLRMLYKALDTKYPDNRTLQQFIAEADAIINAKCAKRYTVPFATVVASSPPIIKVISKNMALYFALRRAYTQSDPNASEWVEGYKNTADEYLDAISAGDLTVVDGSGNTIAPNSSKREVYSNTSGYKPTFDMRDYPDQLVDSDRITDEEDA